MLTCCVRSVRILSGSRSRIPTTLGGIDPCTSVGLLLCPFSVRSLSTESGKGASKRNRKTVQRNDNHTKKREQRVITAAKSTAETHPDDYIFQDIQNRIDYYKRQLRKSVVASYKARDLSTNISNLSQSMAAVQTKRTAADVAAQNAVANIPAWVSIEVLSNGTAQMRPCFVVRTPLKIYLFNCPEGSSRFFPSLRLKATNAHDIFITRGTWDNIAGMSSILLAKEQASPPMRIHGAMNVKHFLECIRPFQDSDFGSVKYPGQCVWKSEEAMSYPCQVDECPYTLGSYEDAGLKVTYIPLSNPVDDHAQMETSRVTVDVSYLLELKEPARKIDPKKLMAKKIPAGPHIGRLKIGQPVTLPDGRTIYPDDVLADSDDGSERNRLLVADCCNMHRLEALETSSVVRPFMNASTSQRIHYVVHLSPPEVYDSEKYQQWMKSLGESTQHIILNGTGPLVPHIESIYRNQRLLRTLAPSLFPEIHPVGWSGIVAQNSEHSRTEGNLSFSAPLQKFSMRRIGDENPIIIDLRPGLTDEDEVEHAWTEEEKVAIDERLQTLKQADSSMPNDSEFPCVSFLGTSSAVPSKYRNVSGYLVETSPNSTFMVDVGEGSYGQIRSLFGEEKCSEILVNMHCVFITHAHQDHMNGLFTIVQRRREAFVERGLPYVPLVLVCNRNVLKPLKTYSMCFEDLQSFVSIVDLSTANPGQQMRDQKEKGGHRSRSNSPRGSPPPALSATMDMIPALPAHLYNADKWNLQGAIAVQVHHTRMANGFVFSIGGKRVVFSGDTKPCDLLVQEGSGADLLIHEATFEDGCEREAERKKHSTMGQAVEIGRKMQAKHVILTHFSARYPKVPDLPKYLDEAGNIGVAMDNMRVRFDHLDLVPKLIPVFRDVYPTELFEIEMRKDQRNLKKKDEKMAYDANLTKGGVGNVVHKKHVLQNNAKGRDSPVAKRKKEDGNDAGDQAKSVAAVNK